MIRMCIFEEKILRRMIGETIEASITLPTKVRGTAPGKVK